ncbi:helix-turn-helix domain-containing protein [Aureisphaera galaxeae]|uniref:helix-turn-helix domain-containing protein n=1 Tax=Aureisphaera galaxeae TaxID=1538023 RepID=UPI0023500B9D|nr:helix-turn-helix domain-containing protein [Aureisphaera galaxeae]MDC8005432.1 helix-turn-helix domain-containing protein [Aureisphaera galaxeae]
MQKRFTEFSTGAFLNLGDESLLQAYDLSKELGHFSFIMTQDESATFSIDGIPTTVPPYNILSLTPIQHLQYVEGRNLKVFQFNREFYCIKDHDKEVSCIGLLFFGNEHIPIIPLTEEDKEKYELLHQVFLDELETTDTIQAEMLRMLMARFIIKTTRLLKRNGTAQKLFKSKIELLRQFNILVEAHFKKEHSVSFYAEQLHKSPKTLSNSFGKLDKSPLKIIHDRIILEAKRLLRYTDKSAKEIAYEVGFDDASHLSRLFKKQTGVSPSQFKKEAELV